MRWLIAAGAGVVLSLNCAVAAASPDTAERDNRAASSARIVVSSPVIAEIAFVGLRRTAAAAVEAQLTSRAGILLDGRRIDSDVKVLGRLGWFKDIRVEELPATDPPSPNGNAQSRVRLVFYVQELPGLVKVTYSGSRLLSTAQIEKILEEKHLSQRLGEPADEYRLDRVAQAIQTALRELGHPQARVQIRRDESSSGTLRVHFQITDGPHLPVGRVDFEGHPAAPKRGLLHEMHRTAPAALFASWRGKGVFTKEGFAEDRSNILIYYQDHGFPEARIGNARVSIYETKSRRWVAWPGSKQQQHLAVSVPIEAGPYYRFSSVDVSPALAAAGGKRTAKLLAAAKAQAGMPYSAKTIEDLRHLWVVASQQRHARGAAMEQSSIEAVRTMDTATHEARVRIAFSNSPPDVVRRIEFRGNQRFSDRYLRRRIGLQEGQPFDERGLELGLARLAKTGYFLQLRKEDVHVDRNEAAHVVDVTIRVSEAGQQRTSFSGGRGQFGNTLGLAYSLFDVLQREELLSASLDGGPESLETVLGLVVEGFLGSRSSLAISVFDNLLRPHFVSSVKGPFYTSQSEGMNAGWGYPLSPADSFSIDYALTHSKTDYSIVLPPSLTGLPSPDLQAKTTSSAVGAAWKHDSGSERIVVANSVSGGALGGTENLIRSNEEYGRIFPDSIFTHQNTWAFRTTFSGVGSYRGDMPLYARLFSGDTQVRGLSPGQLGPYAVIPTTSASGAQTYTAVPAGATVISAANAEYRVPLGSNVQGVGFFDVGAGWLLPNWLGQVRPTLLSSTNGVLHGSLGIELRWTVPEIQVPVRANLSVNVLRLNRFLQLPDGSLFHAHNRLFALGWALGNLF